MILSIRELFDIVIMTLAVGYIFIDLFRLRTRAYFDWRMLWFACLVTAPALILHELAHKFTAIAYGLQAAFHAAYAWLGIGVLLKLVHSPFIFFVPGYVAIQCAIPPCSIAPLTSALVAFAGPAFNIILYATGWFVLKQYHIRSRKWFFFWVVTQRINLLLFILNMLPLPGFDGFKVYQGLYQAFA